MSCSASEIVGLKKRLRPKRPSTPPHQMARLPLRLASFLKHSLLPRSSHYPCIVFPSLFNSKLLPSVKRGQVVICEIKDRNRFRLHTHLYRCPTLLKNQWQDFANLRHCAVDHHLTSTKTISQESLTRHAPRGFHSGMDLCSTNRVCSSL